MKEAKIILKIKATVIVSQEKFVDKQVVSKDFMLLVGSRYSNDVCVARLQIIWLEVPEIETYSYVEDEGKISFEISIIYNLNYEDLENEDDDEIEE